MIKLSPDAAADRLVRACLHRVGPDEILEVFRRRALEAAGRFGQRLTLAEWSRGPGPDGHWLLGDPATGLLIGEDGEARYRAGAAILMPGPAAVAACTRAGVACLATEAGQLALWQLAADSDQAEKLGEADLGVSVTCIAVTDTGQTVVAACGDDKIGVLDGKGLREVADLPFRRVRPGYRRQHRPRSQGRRAGSRSPASGLGPGDPETALRIGHGPARKPDRHSARSEVRDGGRGRDRCRRQVPAQRGTSSSRGRGRRLTAT